jgi:hypothetical protein
MSIHFDDRSLCDVDVVRSLDGTFAPELLDALPADTRDTIMRHAG